jgi:hypothetical protein
MKTIKLWSLSLIWLFLTSSCIHIFDFDNDCVNGSGSVSSENRFVNNFDRISLSGAGQVFVTQGNETAVIIKAQPNILNEIKTEVKDSELRIGVRRCIRAYSEIEIYVTTPNIRSLNISGSGSIKGQNDWFTGDLDLRVSGSGNIQVDAVGEDFKAFVSGSGNIQVAGAAQSLTTSTSGSGDIRAFDLNTQECESIISGSGDVEVSVSNILKARISGSGDVRYKGTPSIQASVSGSGRVINAN